MSKIPPENSAKKNAHFGIRQYDIIRCWSLDWDYRMRYVDTDEEVKLNLEYRFEKGQWLKTKSIIR